MIIVKRKKVASSTSHHGGAWKVAYADFVTAMMAFFLLMWLLNATSEEQRKGLADYFDPSIPLSRNSAGGTGMLNGDDVLSPPDTAMTEETGDRDPRTRHRWRTGPDAPPDEAMADGEDVAHPPALGEKTPSTGAHDENGEDAGGRRADSHATDAGDSERERLDRINERLQAELSAMGDDGLSRHFSMRMTPEGLVIEIGDIHGKPLFDSGLAAPKPLLETLIDIVVPVLGVTVNDIAVVGHTDATPFSNRANYSNWELSADRANVARRLLIAAGLDASRIVRVSGRAATDPISQDPVDEQNRRIAITLLRRTAPGG